jgi:glycine cleavage system pyridoxal-binding protein P
MAELPGVEPAFPERHFFNEFPVRVGDTEAVLGRLEARGILGGLPAQRWFPELAGVLVFCCTEVNDEAALDELLQALREAL